MPLLPGPRPDPLTAAEQRHRLSVSEREDVRHAVRLGRQLIDPRLRAAAVDLARAGLVPLRPRRRWTGRRLLLLASVVGLCVTVAAVAWQVWWVARGSGDPVGLVCDLAYPVGFFSYVRLRRRRLLRAIALNSPTA